MTTKTAAKGAATQMPASPTREELQTAYQVHTLSQILYGHLANAQAWNAPMQFQGMHHPQMGYPSDPMTQVPPMWGYPYGWYR